MKKDLLSSMVKYWMEKTKEAMDSADIELEAGHLSFSANRLYYACFYSVSALLLSKNLKFKKHSGVRAAFHKYIVKTNLIDKEYGKLYDELFEARQSGDYIEFSSFEKKDIENWLKLANDFVEKISKLLESK